PSILDTDAYDLSKHQQLPSTDSQMSSLSPHSIHNGSSHTASSAPSPTTSLRSPTKLAIGIEGSPHRQLSAPQQLSEQLNAAAMYEKGLLQIPHHSRSRSISPRGLSHPASPASLTS